MTGFTFGRSDGRSAHITDSFQINVFKVDSVESGDFIDSVIVLNLEID